MNRTCPPSPALTADYRLIEPLSETLSNGLRLLSVERSSSRFTAFHLVLDGGFSADPADLSGLCSVAASAIARRQLDGRRGRVDRFIERLGGSLRTRVCADAAVLEMSAFSAGLEASLQAFAEAVVEPEFDPQVLEDVSLMHRARIAKERTTPRDIALRTLPSFIYAAGHPYAKPFTGSGTESGLEGISVASIRSFYHRYFGPNGAALVVVGPETRRLRAIVERTFGAWRALDSGPPSHLKSSAALSVPSGKVVVVDVPGTTQSALFAGLPTVPRASASAEPLILIDAILAGMFSSRLNMNLREAKGWTYGVHSLLADARRGGMWLVYSSVERDKSAAAIVEIERELRAIARRNPPSAEEASRAAAQVTLAMPAALETGAQMATALADTVVNGLAQDYYHGFTDRIRALKADELLNVGRRICKSPVTWLLIGDASSIEDNLKSHSVKVPELVINYQSAP